MVPNYGKNQGGFETDLFVVSSEREREYIVGDFGYEPGEVVVTGLSRFDSLLEPDTAVRRQLLILPTWRDWLTDAELYLESDYHARWTELLHHERLHALARAQDLEIVFCLHPNMQRFTSLFSDVPVRVISQGEVDVQQLMKESAVLVTDYSSVGFDFSFLHRPILYYQFDQEHFLGRWGSHLDLDVELPGPIVFTVEDLIDRIEADGRRRPADGPDVPAPSRPVPGPPRPPQLRAHLPGRAAGQEQQQLAAPDGGHRHPDGRRALLPTQPGVLPGHAVHAARAAQAARRRLAGAVRERGRTAVRRQPALRLRGAAAPRAPAAQGVGLQRQDLPAGRAHQGRAATLAVVLLVSGPSALLGQQPELPPLRRASPRRGLPADLARHPAQALAARPGLRRRARLRLPRPGDQGGRAVEPAGLPQPLDHRPDAQRLSL